MSSRARASLGTALLGAILLWAGGASAAPAAAAVASALAPARDSLADDALRLGRASLALRAGRTREVVALLGRVRFAPEPAFAEADRAAFLLAQAYVSLGDVEPFLALARDVAGWSRNTPYTRWLADERRLVETEPGALGAEGAPADTSGVLGHDRTGVELVRLATQALARGEDPSPLLERVPPDARVASRARHMLGLAALERGDRERGLQLLTALLADDPGYAGRHDVQLALAGEALDGARWDDALARYETAEQEWTLHHDAISRWTERADLDSLWDAWSADPQLVPVTILDGAALRRDARRAAELAASLDSRTALAPLAWEAPARTRAAAWPVTPPPPAEWQAVEAAGRRADAADHELASARDEAERRRAALADLRRYLEGGRARLHDEIGRLHGQSTRLDSLAASLAALDARLRDVRDAETRRVRARAAAVIEACDRNLLWLRALQQLHLDGPDPVRAIAAPPGFAGPDSVVRRERAFAGAVRAAAESLAAGAPDRLARSYAQMWRPNLVERIGVLGAETARALAWARALDRSLDSSLARAWTTDSLRRLDARIFALEHTAEELRDAHVALRDRVARAAVQRTLARLDDAHEAIEYGLAAASYARCVRLGEADSALAARATAAPEAPEAEEDSAHVAERDRAIALMDAFLKRHPRSFARGEMRFRLADLRLVAGRQAFRERMAGFVAAQSSGHAAGLAVPVEDHTAALALYRSILAEDSTFAHRDAVLFNAGMILADEGGPGAAAMFAELVRAHPRSTYVQESWLRMGDLEFDAQRYRAGIGHYEHAAAGPDAGLKVIALYKLGWAHYNEDRFLEAADAFRAVLDIYDSAPRAAIGVDLEGESEAYLVHALAGAGGAPAFAAYFDRIGPRPYERRVLMALGQHFRRYGEFPDAAAADELCIRRYPNEADALTSAGRLIETYRRSNRPDRERQVQVELAERFAPGGAWAKAQPSDSVRSAGERFAREAWTSAALDHHRRARATGAAAEWREALRLEETLLAHWPDGAEAAALELEAGESCARLEDYPAALAHAGRAASLGPDSLATRALEQRVALADAWYESTRSRTGRAATGLGRDSLAHAVLDAGDALRARYPQDPQLADVTWRQGQLALAHGWHERALADLDEMVRAHPDDRRSPLAATQRGEALFRLQRFEDAGAAFAAAQALAQRAGRDTLARRAAAEIPICLYRAAEASVAADSNAFATHAEKFARVAREWPAFAHADLAQYRAGLAWGSAKKDAEAAAAMRALIANFPKSEYVRDAHLHLAGALERDGQREEAADALAEFARRWPADEGARAAWLKSADLLEASGHGERAEAARLDYLKRHPEDHEAAMEILEPLARRDLAGVGPGHPVAALFAAPVKGRPAAPATSLERYLRLAAAHPDLASRPLLAEVRFRHAEDAQQAFAAARLTQPLAKSLPAKQRGLDTLLVRYRRCVDQGVPEWAHASTLRIGEALVAFGDALQQMERPADLQGDDRVAYDEVLAEQAQPFYDRGEGVWADALKQRDRSESMDRWMAQAQDELWKRLGRRFYFRPEAEFPLVAAKAPRPVHADVEPETKETRRAKKLAAKAARASKPRHERKPRHDREALANRPVKASRFDEAREQAALAPAEAYWPFHLAELEIAADSAAVADAALDASLQRDPAYAPALALMSKRLFVTGRHDEAVQRLADVREHPERFPVEARLALLAGLALHEDALGRRPELAALRDSAGHDDLATTGSALVYVALRGEHPEAADGLADDVLSASRSAANLNNQGITRLRSGDAEGARKALLAANDRDATLAGPYYNLAILEKFYRFDGPEAARWFGAYLQRSQADPDGLLGAIGRGEQKPLAGDDKGGEK